MAMSNFLGCLFCGQRGKKDVEDDKPSASQPYNNYEKTSPQTLLETNDSFETESYTTKHESSELQSQFTEEPKIEVGPPANRALVVASKKVYDIVDHPFPSLHNEDEVIIANYAVGLNPIDWKSVDFNFCLPEFPWITGREMAGVVEKVGANVKDIKVGDRVWTSTYYRDRRAGCFQHFVTVPQHTVCPIPQNVAFEPAACLGVAGLVAAMTLWKWLQIPRSPADENLTTSSTGYLLIWGGSSVTAQFATQIAARSGIPIIAVTSAKTKPLAESLGATHVVVRDGKTNDDIVAEIRAIGGDDITRAIDLVGTETAGYCLKALSTSQPALFAPLAMISSKAIVPANVTVETVEMKQFVNNPDSRIYAMELNRLVEQGLVKLPKVEVLKGGLHAVQGGLDRLKGGDMAGSKLVVSMV